MLFFSFIWFGNLDESSMQNSKYLTEIQQDPIAVPILPADWIGRIGAQGMFVLQFSKGLIYFSLVKFDININIDRVCDIRKPKYRLLVQTRKKGAIFHPVRLCVRYSDADCEQK